MEVIQCAQEILCGVQRARGGHVVSPHFKDGMGISADDFLNMVFLCDFILPNVEAGRNISAIVTLDAVDIRSMGSDFLLFKNGLVSFLIVRMGHIYHAALAFDFLYGLFRAHHGADIFMDVEPDDFPFVGHDFFAKDDFQFISPLGAVVLELLRPFDGIMLRDGDVVYMVFSAFPIEQKEGQHTIVGILRMHVGDDFVCLSHGYTAFFLVIQGGNVKGRHMP